jgi:DNA-binding CsgD family transcriptional regulator
MSQLATLPAANSHSAESFQKLESDISALRELVVSLSAALLRSIAGGNTQNRHSEHFTEAEQLLHDAEECFHCAKNPSVKKAVAASLEVAGQQAMAKAIELEKVVQRDTPHSRKNQADARALYRSARLELLTPREMTIFTEVASGASSKQTARSLNISPRTVDAHRANILQKLGAKSTVDLLRIVLTQGDPNVFGTK